MISLHGTRLACCFLMFLAGGCGPGGGAAAAPANEAASSAAAAAEAKAQYSAPVAVKLRTLSREIENLPHEDALDGQELSEYVRRRFEAELAACRDDTCRLSRLDDQIARLRYSDGRSGPSNGLPWRTGKSMSDRGEMSILPLGGGEIAVWVWAVGDEGRWLCDVSATGHLQPDGQAVMTVYEPDIKKPAQFLLRSDGPRRITLRRLGTVAAGAEEVLVGEDDEQFEMPLYGYCGRNGSFLGEYEVYGSK